MRKAKITVTINESIIKEIDRLAEIQHESRSQLVEGAIKYWQQMQIKQELTKGYQAMAKEDIKTAEDHLLTGIEVLE